FLYPMNCAAWIRQHAFRSHTSPITHNWDRSPGEAHPLQDRVINRDDFSYPLRYVCRTNVGFEQSGRITGAAVAILEYPALKLTEQTKTRKLL
ncbi:MAG: hypothetical protein P8101_22265, partial [Candidatus Thiodiazotropha sp.]